MISARQFVNCGRLIAGGLVWICAGVASGQYARVNPSHSFAPDQCGPADPAYIRTSNETGGIPLFLQRSEAGKAMQLMRESTRENVSTVLWASAKLTGSTQTFEIPVDSVAQRITFTFSVDTKGSRLVLTDPNGKEAAAGLLRTEDTELNCGRIITIEKPATGIWRAKVNGSGTYWLEVEAQSDIYFIKAEFVELGGRLGHEGLFKIHGQPVAGKPATLQVSLSAADAKTTEFAFVSEHGDLLQRLRLAPSDNDREFLEFTGDVDLPTVPFRIEVKGRDVNGTPYQRFNGPLFHPETVQVIPKLDFDEVSPGATRDAIFEVKNTGAARSFKVLASDARRFITGAEPQELQIGANETALVRIRLAVPSTSAENVEDDLVIVATSTSGEATTNSAIVHVSVASISTGESR